MMYLPNLTETQKLEMFLKHLADNPLWKMDIDRTMHEKDLPREEAIKHVIHENQGRFICPRCERGTMRTGFNQITSKNFGRCEKCGDITSITVKEYLTARYYKG